LEQHIASFYRVKEWVKHEVGCKLNEWKNTGLYRKCGDRKEIASSHWLSLRNSVCGRAIAQAVSRWLSIAAARVQTRIWSSGFCGGQSGAGAGFLRVLRFPLPIFIPPNSPSS
jgi:hypothetical protein